MRKHRPPEYIMQLIDACGGGYIVPLSGQAIYKRWSKLIEHGLPHITFHGLRHVPEMKVEALSNLQLVLADYV